MVTKLKSDTTVSLMFFQHWDFCVLELYKSTATWSLLCVCIYIYIYIYIYLYFSYIKNSYLRVNKSEVPWNVLIGVMFSTHILKLSTMVVWRIIYNLAVHSYWSLFVLFFFLVGGGGDTEIFFITRLLSILDIFNHSCLCWWSFQVMKVKEELKT